MRNIVDLMTQEIVRLDPEQSLIDAVRLMREKRVGSVLVMKNDSVVGIFTERDLLNKINLDNPAAITSIKTKDVMTRELITVDYQEFFVKVIELMRTHNIRHTPVTKDGRIIGIVSLRELLTHYEEYLEQLLNEKEAQFVGALKDKNESEERFRTIFNNSAVAITLTDKDERIIAFNPFAAQLLGMSDKDLFHRPVKDLYPPEEWANIRSLNIRKFGMKHHLETKMIGKDKAPIDVDISISILKDALGNVTGSIGIIRDIRERKRTESELEKYRKHLEEFVDKRTQELVSVNESLRLENNERKKVEEALQKAYDELQKTQSQLIEFEKIQVAGGLASGVAHEVKNPLMIIDQGISLLRHKVGENDPEILKILNHMESAVERADRIIHGLIDFSSISELKFENINVITVLDEVLELAAHSLRKSQITVKKEYQQNLPCADLDKNKIEQVFINLILNAVNVLMQGGVITIRAYQKEFNEYVEGIAGHRKVDLFKIGETAVIVEIEDNGPGIPPEIYGKIFDPFFTTRRTEGGTGLGLSVVKNIVAMHHGAIRIANRTDARGVKAIVLLRLKQPSVSYSEPNLKGS